MTAREVLPPTPGRHEMTNEAYHAADAVSKSRLDEFAKSPQHFWLKYENPNRAPSEQTEAMLIGSAVHCAVLEPDLFQQRYFSPPKDAPKRPSSTQVNAKNPSADTLIAVAWWRDFQDANKGKDLLTAEQHAECLALRDCVHADNRIASLLADGQSEQSYFAADPETGLLLKVRPDFITGGGVFLDLKVVRDASPWGFGRACAAHRYDVQAAFYPDVLRLLYPDTRRAFAFLAVEKNEAGPVAAIYYADDEMIASGRAKWRREVSALAVCKKFNHWPGYTPEPQPVLFPKYALATE